MTDIASKIAAYHHPELIASPEGGDGAHVCQVWEDGEVTLTKGGSLYGQRNLHCIEPPLGKALPLEFMPCQLTAHAYVVVRYDDRLAVRTIIADALGTVA